MRKNTTEEPLYLADCRIKDAQERIRRQKDQLLQMLAQGQDASLKLQFILLLTNSLRRMRQYRAGIFRTQHHKAANKEFQSPL